MKRRWFKLCTTPFFKMNAINTFFRQLVTGRLGGAVDAKAIGSHLDELKKLLKNTKDLSKESQISLLQEGEAAIEAIKARLRPGKIELSPNQAKQLDELEASVAQLRKDSNYQPNWTPKQIVEKPQNVVDMFQDYVGDKVSLVPGVGSIADAVSAGVDVIQGQPVDAATRALGIIPFGGTLKGGAKVLAKAGAEAIEAAAKQLADVASQSVSKFRLFRESETVTLKMSFSSDAAAKKAIEEAEKTVGAQYATAKGALEKQLASAEGDAAHGIKKEIRQLDGDYNQFNLDAAAARDKWDLSRTAYSAPLPSKVASKLVGFPEATPLFKQYKTAPDAGRVSVGHQPELQIPNMVQQAVKDLPPELLSRSPADVAAFLLQRVDKTLQLTSAERSAFKEFITRAFQQ